MQQDFSNVVLVVGAVVALAALVIGVVRIFGKKTRSLAAAILWMLAGLFGIATVVWILTRPHAGPGAELEATANSETMSSQTTASTASTSTADRAGGSVAPPVPASNASAAEGTSPPAQPDQVLLATSAFLDCLLPAEPTDIPDGANASFDQMRSARTSVMAYDAATNAYLNCVDSIGRDLTHQNHVVTSPSNYETLKSIAVRLHNVAVDRDRAVADRLNRQIRIYKANHAP